MSEQEAFVEEICARPDDLTSRQVYADWLIERGDPRGTFIAGQIQLTQMTGFEADYPRLLAESLRLESQHAPDWIGDILSKAKFDPDQYSSRLEISPLQNARFRNGFLERIALPLEDVPRHWDVFVAQEPLSGAELILGEGIPDELRELAAAEKWESLKATSHGWFTAHSVGEVLGWGLDAIKELDLSGCDLGVDGSKLLANHETTLGDTFEDWQAPPPINHKQLRALHLKNCQLTDEGFQILASCKGLAKLETLDISQCRLADSASLDALQSFKGLKNLSLAGNNALDLAALAGWTVLKKLQRLAVPQSTTAEAFEKLYPKPSKQLISLDLASAKVLLASPEVVANASPKFLELNIGTTRVGDKGFESLLAAPSLKSLVRFNAKGCSLSDKAVGMLADSDLDRLVELDLSSNKLTDKALEQLVEWPGITDLAELRLGNNRKITSTGYDALIDSTDFWPATLDIGKCTDKKLVKKLTERFGNALMHTL